MHRKDQNLKTVTKSFGELGKIIFLKRYKYKLKIDELKNKIDYAINRNSNIFFCESIRFQTFHKIVEFEKVIWIKYQKVTNKSDMSRTAMLIQAQVPICARIKQNETIQFCIVEMLNSFQNLLKVL